MRVLFKYLFRFLLILLILVVAGALLAPYLVDPADYLDEVNEELRYSVGLELVPQGEMRLSVLPWLGVATGQALLKDAYTGETIVTWDKARASLAYRPLLSGEYVLDSFSMEGAAMDVTAPNEAGETEILARLIDLELDLGPVNIKQLDQPMAVDATWRTELPEQSMALASTLEVEAFLDADLSVLCLRDLDLTLAFLGKHLVLQADCDLNMRDMALECPLLTLDGLGASLEASGVALSNLAEDPLLKGRFVLSGDPREIMAGLGLPDMATQDPDVLRRVRLETRVEFQGETLRLAELDGEIDGSTLSGEIVATPESAEL
ncbi:MAG: AsmA family protein, partial [Desulfovibrio sp.]